MITSKRILFIAATHGDEGYAIPVLESLEKKYSRDEYSYDWIIGNPKAFAVGKRFVDTDMNRAAPGSQTSELYEERRVAEIIDIAKKYDVVIDIHGTSSDCGVTTLIPLPNEGNLELARQMNIKRNVIWQSSNPDRKTGPISEFVSATAIEIECGPKTDSTVARDLEQVLEKFILANNKGERSYSESDVQFYEVYGKLPRAEAPESLQLEDFVSVMYQDEIFYPYLSNNSYIDTICYKMRKI